MNTYKITNITDTFGKRDIKYMTDVNIDYIDGFKKKTIIVKPSKNVLITTNSLPLSVHRFRLKNMIIVEEVKDESKDYKIKTSESLLSIVKKKIENLTETDDNKKKKISKTSTKKNDDV